MTRGRKPKYLKALEAIEQRNNGLLTPRLVVEEARDPQSVLHKAFDWDDTTAAEKFRLYQARQLITTVKVRIEDTGEQAFFNAVVQVGSVRKQGYVTRERVISDDDIYTQVLQGALKELDYWSKKYESIKELKRVINYDEVNKLK